MLQLQLQLVSLWHTIQFKYADWVRKFGCSSNRTELNRAGNQTELELELEAKGIKANVHVQLLEQEQESWLLLLLLLLRRVFNWLWLWLFSYSIFGVPLCQWPVLPLPHHNPLLLLLQLCFSHKFCLLMSFMLHCGRERGEKPHM